MKPREAHIAPGASVQRKADPAFQGQKSGKQQDYWGDAAILTSRQ